MVVAEEAAFDGVVVDDGYDDCLFAYDDVRGADGSFPSRHYPSQDVFYF